MRLHSSADPRDADDDYDHDHDHDRRQRTAYAHRRSRVRAVVAVAIAIAEAARPHRPDGRFALFVKIRRNPRPATRSACVFAPD
jgi:hypothetical protein